MREREFLEHAKNCSNPACMADAKLRAYGARLRPGKGRHCELLMLAAAGADGLSDVELVLGRRAQAEHLGVTLSGPTADAPNAAHARHAADGHLVGVPGAINPINLGSVRVKRTPSTMSEALDHYVMIWP